MIKQLTIIGLGLIGGSVARAIKPTGFCQTIVAYDNDEETLKTAKKLQIIDDYAKDISAAVNNADLVLLATPLNALPEVLTKIKSSIHHKTFITDVCSVKESVISLAKNILAENFSNFVPGHPIAGSEKSGIAAAKSDLFENRLIILTPTADTKPSALETVELFWRQTAAQVEIMEANLHDQILAATSHLPQMLAYTFMQDMAQKKYPNILNYAGSGLKDFTRLAGSNPDLWINISLENRCAIVEEIEIFKKYLNLLQQAIENQDREKLLEIFTTARDARNKLLT